MTRFNEMRFGQKWALWNGSAVAVSAGRMLKVFAFTAQNRLINIMTAQNRTMRVFTAMNRKVRVFITGG